MKTIAQQLNIKEFPFTIKNKNGNVIYFENINEYWEKSEYKDGNQIYFESSDGTIIDNRPKEMTVSELEKLTGIKNLKIVK